LQEQLRSHAERHHLSASEVVREALSKYLAQHAASPYELGAGLFGDLPRITEILGKDRNLPADFADASLVALCDHFPLD
jgi:hypothetical protein